MLTPTDWVLIGSTLFLGIIAIIAPYGAELLKRSFLAPKLLISFRQSPPICRLASRRSISTPTSVVPSYEFHFQVKNRGKSQARQVEAVLEDIWIYDTSGKPSRIKDFVSVKLRYDNEGTRFVDINPERQILWNLGYILSSPQHPWIRNELLINAPEGEEDGLRFFLDLLERPFEQPNCFLPGIYGIKVVIYSENAKPSEVNFKIVWSGNWKETEKEMFQEIVIIKVKSSA